MPTDPQKQANDPAEKQEQKGDDTERQPMPPGVSAPKPAEADPNDRSLPGH